MRKRQEAVPILPGGTRNKLYIEFVAQPPYKSWGLRIMADPGNFVIDGPGVPDHERERAREIVAALEAAGWGFECFAEDTIMPCWDGFKPGTGVFNGWKKDEGKRLMAEARKILRKFGLTRIPKRELTLADMM